VPRDGIVGEEPKVVQRPPGIAAGSCPPGEQALLFRRLRHRLPGRERSFRPVCEGEELEQEVRIAQVRIVESGGHLRDCSSE
jgi:hypothetical protein